LPYIDKKAYFDELNGYLMKAGVLVHVQA